MLPPEQPPPPPQPPQPSPFLDALQRRRWIDRDGAGNTRPPAVQHNTMLNNMCSAAVHHLPYTNLPTTIPAYRKLGAYLAAISAQPIRCCHNCGMLNYPTPGDKIIVRANGCNDLRAWRVYGEMLEDMQQQHVAMGEIFLCEDVGPDTHGHARRRVFSCMACRREASRDPTKYDLFDGHRSDGAGGWAYEPNGVGEPVPEPLAGLTSQERLALGVVKMVDAAFEPA